MVFITFQTLLVDFNCCSKPEEKKNKHVKVVNNC